MFTQYNKSLQYNNMFFFCSVKQKYRKQKKNKVLTEKGQSEEKNLITSNKQLKNLQIKNKKQ